MRRAVDLKVAVNLSCVGPGTSATKRSRPSIPKPGMIAKSNTMIPIPPIHWVKERQNRVAWGKASTLFITEEPVVVKPDMVSNMASTIDGIVPPNK